jgi:signal transduction histidine kinase
MFKGKSFAAFTVLIILNVAGLFYLEYNNPQIVSDYTSHKQQVYDVYLSVIFFGVLVFIMMYVAKSSFFMAYIEAKNSDKLKTSFLENISHEIRTPLNAIVGFSNLLMMGNISKETRDEYVKLIRQSNKSLLGLVDEILDVSLLENNEMKLIEERVNVNEFLQNLYDEYRKKIKPDMELMVIKPEDDLIISGDEKRLNQVFVNLLDNAVKFTYEGKIVFGVKVMPSNLLFFVKDTGIGIETKYHKLLFERFYKVDNKKDVLYRGTGIGLYFCKKLVDLMKGKIWVESEVGKGSKFYFSIPKKVIK